MKKIFPLFILSAFLLSPAIPFAQTAHPFELGFNAGASWLKSDVKMKKLGGGWGLTFGQMYCMNPKSPLMWGWRLRYLNANTYGQGLQRNTGIANNNLLNGTRDTILDYNSDPGYVYDNYKTHIDELSLEVLLGANKLREKTNFYPYIFGGIGITKAVAKTDQLNANGLRYNYAAIDSAGTSGSGLVSGRLGDMYDGSYESLADGNASPSWKFMPSLGVGLGYEVIKGFSIGLEHKVTWGLNDVLDGQQWSGTNTPTGNNDKYHYSSIWLKFSFGRGAKTTTNTTNTSTTNVTTTTNTPVVAPAITFSNPATPGTTIHQQNTSIKGKITDINSISDMSMTLNGMPVTGYTYNAGSDMFNYPATLISGANTVVVTATNTAGTSTSTTTIVYDQPVVVALPPVVAITYPNTNPYTTSVGTISITGTVQQITSLTQMVVTVNGMPNNAFTYNTSSHAFNITYNLIQGANTFAIAATNSVGSDSKSITVIYQPPVVQTTPPPLVTIVNPSVNPFNTTTGIATITATVMNVGSVGQITATLNGGPIPTAALNFNPGTHQLIFNVNLIAGANTIVVGATNVSGADSKTETIVYTAPVLMNKPAVTITNPASNPFTTTTSVATVNATITNIASVGQISVTLNGGPVPTAALNFNAASQQLMFNVNLIAGANTIVVGATNVAGADSKTETIIYTQPVVVQPPVVSITVPNVNPMNTAVSSVVFTATVLNVNAVAQLQVVHNGSPLPLSVLNFNPATKQLAFTLNVIPGNNTISITATNAAGSDSKTQTVIYTQPVVVQLPVVTITNPSSNPFNTTSNTASVSATVLNVSNASQINVSVNGTPTTAFSYNAATHQINFNVNLITGANSIVVSASNSAGSDSKTETIIYSAPAVIPPPVVTITNPNINPFNTSMSTATVNATVLNVTSAGQINVTLNGVATTAFTFNPAMQQLTFNANLIPGANTVYIFASNAGGSDSKTGTIIYTIPVPAPVVTITNPIANPFNTASNAATLSATILNITAAGQIAVTLNGVITTSFSFNPASQQMMLNLNLVAGSNAIVVSASNAAGSDSKSQIIIYTPPIVVVPPVVSYLNPTANPFGTTNPTHAVVAKVLNVTTASQITVKVNGTLLPTFGFAAATKKVSFTANLIEGNNTIVVTGTNSAGTDSKTLSINYTKPITPVGTDTMPTNDPSPTGPIRPTGTASSATLGGGSGLPVMTMLMPASSPFTSPDPVCNVLIKVEGIIKAAAVTVKINGAVFPGFNYDSASKMLSFPVNLVVGENVVVIEATNPKGTKSETLKIIKMR